MADTEINYEKFTARDVVELFKALTESDISNAEGAGKVKEVLEGIYDRGWYNGYDEGRNEASDSTSPSWYNGE